MVYSYTATLTTGDINGHEKARSLTGLGRKDVKLVTAAFKTILEVQYQVPVNAVYAQDDIGEITTFEANVEGGTTLLGIVLVNRE